jgi:hypothetical protein
MQFGDLQQYQGNGGVVDEEMVDINEEELIQIYGAGIKVLVWAYATNLSPGDFNDLKASASFD